MRAFMKFIWLGILCLLPLAQPETAMAKTLEEIKKTFFERQLEFDPVGAFHLGVAAYESRVRLDDESSRSGMRAYAVRLLADLESYPPGLLPTTDRIDAQILRAWALFTLLRLENPTPLGWNSTADISRLVDIVYHNLARQKGEPARWEAILSRMRAIPQLVRQQQTNLEAGLQSKAPFYSRDVERDGIGLKDVVLQYFSHNVAETARASMSPADFGKIASGLKDAASDIGDAVRSYVKFLKLRVLPVARETVFAVGEEEYAWRLRHLLLSRETPESLFAYGKTQVEATEKEMQALSDSIQKSRKSPPKPAAEVIADLEKDAPKTDAEMMAMYRSQVVRAVDFIRAKKLFRLPPDYTIELAETPEAYHNVLSVAAMNPVPPFADGINAQFWLTPTRNAANPEGDPRLLAENHAKPMAPNLVVHEAVPGHDLQLGYSARRFVVGGRQDLSFEVRLFMPDVMSSLGVEGWAHYTEQLMAERGFYTPEERLFQLKDAQWRNVRIVVDVGIHTGRMSYDEAVAYFDQKTHSGKVTSEREIYRYSKWPLQAVTYHLGKRDILELREEIRKSVGVRAFDLTRFHEMLLAYDGVPVSLYHDEVLSKLKSRFTRRSR